MSIGGSTPSVTLLARFCQLFTPPKSSRTRARAAVGSTFPVSPPFIPYGGFSPIRLEVNLPGAALPLQGKRLTTRWCSPGHRHSSRRFYPLTRPSPYSRAHLIHRLTHRPLAPGRLYCPSLHRYYGLIRQSPALRAASPFLGLLRPVFILSNCTGHLPLFAPEDLLDVPLPLPCRSLLIGDGSLHQKGSWFGLRVVPLESGSCGCFNEAAVLA